VPRNRGSAAKRRLRDPWPVGTIARIGIHREHPCEDAARSRVVPYRFEDLWDALDRQRRDRHLGRVADVVADDAATRGTSVIRFDVERDLPHLLGMARRLAAREIHCSMYFHTRRGCYDAGMLREVQDLGHEVGLHHECLDRCAGDFSSARDTLRREVDLFRDDGIELRTVCSHGEGGITRRGYAGNWELFVRYPDLLAELGLLDEVYFWIRRTRPLYASDTLAGYRRFWSNVELSLQSPERAFHMLVHPHRWRRHAIRSLWEVGVDLGRHAANRIKRARSYDLAYD
jgi:hypothetical protein